MTDWFGRAEELRDVTVGLDYDEAWSRSEAMHDDYAGEDEGHDE